MVTLNFETISFKEKGDTIVGTFLQMFEFTIPKAELQKISTYTIDHNTISFDAPHAEKRFSHLLFRGFDNLTNKLNGKPTTYINKASGIPLIGNVAFGILDRGTKTIEIRSISSCNIRCTFCSVDEDQRPRDFVVEADYLIEETQKLIEAKKIDGIEILINSQGEPTLYRDLVHLVKGLSAIPQVTDITLITNGTLMPLDRADKLIDAGVTRFNISINAIDEKVADELAGAKYNINTVLDLVRYLSTKVNITIAPVYVPGQNDDELEKIVAFVKEVQNDKYDIKCGIQNFLPYKFGRNPVKQAPWESFFDKLKTLQEKYGVKLIVDEKDFPETLTKVGELPKPFKKGDVIQAEIKCPGRLPGEMLAAAQGRTISLMNYTGPKTGTVTVKIMRSKHNIFSGIAV